MGITPYPMIIILLSPKKIHPRCAAEVDFVNDKKFFVCWPNRECLKVSFFISVRNQMALGKQGHNQVNYRNNVIPDKGKETVEIYNGIGKELLKEIKQAEGADALDVHDVVALGNGAAGGNINQHGAAGSGAHDSFGRVDDVVADYIVGLLTLGKLGAYKALFHVKALVDGGDIGSGAVVLEENGNIGNHFSGGKVAAEIFVQILFHPDIFVGNLIHIPACDVGTAEGFGNAGAHKFEIGSLGIAVVVVFAEVQPAVGNGEVSTVKIGLDIIGLANGDHVAFTHAPEGTVTSAALGVNFELLAVGIINGDGDGIAGLAGFVHQKILTGGLNGIPLGNFAAAEIVGVVLNGADRGGNDYLIGGKSDGCEGEQGNNRKNKCKDFFHVQISSSLY